MSLKSVIRERDNLRAELIRVRDELAQLRVAASRAERGDEDTRRSTDADKRVAVLMRNAAALLAEMDYEALDVDDNSERFRLVHELPMEAERFYPIEESLRDQGFPNKLDGSWNAARSASRPEEPTE